MPEAASVFAAGYLCVATLSAGSPMPSQRDSQPELDDLSKPGDGMDLGCQAATGARIFGFLKSPRFRLSLTWIRNPHGRSSVRSRPPGPASC